MAYNDRVRILIILPILTLLLIPVAACGGDSADRTYERSGSNQPDAEPDGTLIAFLGDSLTAGLGLAGDGPFPTIAGELLRKQGLAVRIVNAGVSAHWAMSRWCAPQSVICPPEYSYHQRNV